MSWRLDGTYFENCNCNVVCPCGASAFSEPADNERCHVLLAFHVDSGEIDGLDVSGRNIALFADAPGKMADGGWKIGVFLDGAATDEQRDALVAVFSGQRGGPPEMFAPMLGEMMGAEVASIDYVDDGLKHSVRIGDLVDIEVEDIAPQGPEGETIKLTGIVHPANSTLTVSRATRSKISAFGYDLSYEGKNGHSAPFSWAA
jgi:hypothetical protein